MAPLMGDGDDLITELYHAQSCFSERAKGKFLFSRQTSTEKPRGLVGFELRTEPRDSLYQCTTAHPLKLLKRQDESLYSLAP